MKTIKKKHKKYHNKRKLTRAKKGGRPTLNDVKKLKKLFDTNITKFNEQIRNTGHIPLINILQMIYNNVEFSNIQNIIVNQLYNLYNSNKNFFNQQLLLLDYSSLAYLLQSIPNTAIYSDFRQNVNDILIFRSRNPIIANIAQNLSDSQAYWSHSDSMFGPIADVVLDDEMAEVSQLSAQAKPFSPASRLSASAQPFNPASRLSASAQSFTPSVPQSSRPSAQEIQWLPDEDEDYVIELGVHSLTSKPPPVAQPSRPPPVAQPSRPPPVAQPSRPPVAQPSRPPVAQPSRPPSVAQPSRPLVAQPSKSSKRKYVVESDSETDSDTEGEDEINITLSEHAKERMDERRITLDDITYLIKRAKRYKKASNDHGNVRIYTGEIPGESDLYKIITSDSADPFVITVIRDKDLYSQKVLNDMAENDISPELIEYIIWNTKKYVAEQSDEQGGRLEFSYTTDGENITVYTNKGRTKIIGIRVKSMYSPVSQRNQTHMIDYKTEGCALQRTHVSEDKGVDCGRCAISYAGLGTSVARSKLQNMCVKKIGAGNFEMNKWLAENVVIKDMDAETRKKIPPEYLRPPRIYYIHPEFVKSIQQYVGKNNKFGVAAESISDKLLGYNEQVISFWDCHKTYGHYFNIGKLNSDTIWYIDPQSGLNPGNITLLDKINQTCGQGSWVTQIAFILQPWQADLLFDNNGKPLLISAVEYDKKGYHHTGGTRKRKTRKCKAKNSRTRKCKAKKCKTRKYKAKKYKTRKYSKNSARNNQHQ